MTKSPTSKRPAGNIMSTNEGIIKARLEQNTLHPSRRVQLMPKLSLALHLILFKMLKSRGNEKISLWFTLVLQ